MQKRDDWIEKLKKNFSSQKINKIIKQMEKSGFCGHIIAIEDINSLEAEAAMEYIEYHQYLIRHSPRKKTSNREIENLKNRILSNQTKIKAKKETIVKLSQIGTKKSLEILRNYQRKADPYLKIWINLAINECKTLLKSKYSKKPTIIIDRITQKEKRKPYRICDRWCERCNQKNNCSFYQKVIFNKINSIIQQRELNNFEIFFGDKFKNLRHLNHLSRIGEGELSLKNTVEIFYENIRRLLEKSFSEFIQSPENFYDSELALRELAWYSLVFKINFYIVFTNLVQKEQLDKASAKIALKSLKVCQKALEEISVKCPGYMMWAKNLAIFASLLLEKIETRLPKLDKMKIIFHSYYDV